jgi:hypothetical protein
MSEIISVPIGAIDANPGDMLEPKPKPKTKALAVTRRHGPPRVLIGRENGKAFYVNATCDAVRMVLAEGRAVIGCWRPPSLQKTQR